MKEIKEFAPAIDIFGCNSYRGKAGFGGMWHDVSLTLGKPVMITEFGCDAYWQGRSFSEDKQLDYLTGNWSAGFIHSERTPLPSHQACMKFYYSRVKNHLSEKSSGLNNHDDYSISLIDLQIISTAS